MCPLEFWTKWQNHLPGLAKIAKKYQGVQASSSACERMFSIAGNIFLLKTQKNVSTTIYYFSFFET
jgi:hypothetical protein